ncbi:pyruvate dehydrogenase E2 component (dihydrolipoamide acetyltransferase) [Serratia symbiotica str. 'Cinara cedri']|nr:pyruvate dehydrogenase E2 component (dihydrolipoamide acetyltransferase) [Serratia symbiotica str. 'Cinara cedri']
MSIEINIPDIGVDEVEVTEIMVQVSDKIEAEQSLITVEGDKASIEVPSPCAGIVKEIKVAVGDIVKSGKLIMIFEQDDFKQAPSEEKIVHALNVIKYVAIPDIGSQEVEITKVMVKVGNQVVTGQSLITIKGYKELTEVPAPFTGTVQEICIKPGDKVRTGSSIMALIVTDEGSLVTDGAAVTGAALIPVTQEVEATVPIGAITSIDSQDKFSENLAYVHATPVIRRLAREFGIDLRDIKGSGYKDRILREDIKAYIKGLIDHTATASSAVLPSMRPWPKVDFSKFGEIEEIDIGRIQKNSGANLSRNWTMIPHVTHFDKVDISDLEVFRKQQNEDVAKRKLDVKFTPVVFVIKAVACALEQMPRFNSSLSCNGQKLIIKKYINIGVAVDTPNGLVVPVLKDINKKGIIEISRELTVISKRARDGKLTACEMQGACFTISSLGGIGTTYFAPIINAPEVAILGISKFVMEPRWNGKKFIPRLMMPMSLSFDHRVIDGADGARFITIISNILYDIRCLIM